MPFFYLPRSRRFFENIPCPPDCQIPTGDDQAYGLHPEHRWIYNKLTITELQNIPCGPHKTYPPADIFPIFSKPIYNLGGMGAGSRTMETEDDYWASITPGHMWSVLLHGKHYSTDIAVVAGKVVWMSHARGETGPQQTFDYWEINVPVDPSIRQCITEFVEAHLGTFSGMLNMETIGNKIIEVHLRFSPQWPDIYGEWVLPALVELYSRGEWTGPAKTPEVGYSVVLFDDERCAKLSTKVTDECLRHMEEVFGVNSITMRYSSDVPFESISRPEGGYRVAWINGFDLGTCKKARELLREFLYGLGGKN